MSPGQSCVPSGACASASVSKAMMECLRQRAETESELPSPAKSSPQPHFANAGSACLRIWVRDREAGRAAMACLAHGQTVCDSLFTQVIGRGGETVREACSIDLGSRRSSRKLRGDGKVGCRHQGVGCALRACETMETDRCRKLRRWLLAAKTGKSS